LSLLGPADAIVGVHAGVALLSAIEHRRRTGEGQLIEVAQIEVGANLTAESVIEFSMNGVVSPREGNRQRDHVQGVYPTNDEHTWVAISVRDDRDWSQLLEAMSDATALRDARFATQEARRAAHDEIDQQIGAWTSTHTADEVAGALQAHRVPAARVLTNDRMYDEPHLNARGFYTTFEHPVTGVRRYPGWPLRFTPGPTHHHLTPPPTLGQHNVEILSDRLGLSPTEIHDLREKNIIGERPLNL
jgi:crotonobetainyl-CoA:carnitine CoA-transferase CaiB-like acyl-CoA transferase